MSKTIFLSFTLILALFVNAQHKIRFEIDQLPANHDRNSDIYIAGSFNSWNPQDRNFRFTNINGKYFIEFNLPEGSHEYKITRGGWDKVETSASGAAINNRIIRVDKPETVRVNIIEWQDRFKTEPRKHTASRNVIVIDTAFFIPQLNRKRRIWIYLPPDHTTKKYPVLYMHDGQNVFDDATSFSGEWGIDEFMDTTSKQKMIVVAVDHGGDKRLNEYNPYDHQRFGKGEGEEYINFLVKTLKPYIDKRYRTKRKKEYTFIAGSSMGGLISMYAALKYPKVFGGAGVFSPAFWTAPAIDHDIRKYGRKLKSKVYFYAGKLEGDAMVPDMLKAFDVMLKVSKAKMITVIRDEGRHNEPTWRKEFPLFYNWLVE